MNARPSPFRILPSNVYCARCETPAEAISAAVYRCVNEKCKEHNRPWKISPPILFGNFVGEKNA